MSEISLQSFMAAFAEPSHSPKPGGRLVIAGSPQPFVPPTLNLPTCGSSESIAAEVIFVRASAAVGKSTMANFVSATRKLPLLNLAKVPVSTGSLRALISSLAGPGDPIEAFHSGGLPIIIDALDEGRLLSGETGFESFLETTGELLLEDRGVTDRPKLIVFGRFESTQLAGIGIELYGEGVTTTSVEVGFFGRDQAWQLIDAYAKAAAEPSAAYRRHPEPVRDLIRSYFDAIEASLGLDKDQLWNSDRGRAFAGYAPVLAAVGSMLAKMENFKHVANSLRAAGAQEAWGVIETVLKEILNREKGKLCDQLVAQVAAPVPKEAYDEQEQLTLLTQHVHGQSLSGTGRVQMPAPDQTTYISMVERYVPEHPFVREREFANVVLGSVVLAHAVSDDLLRSAGLDRLAESSRQPFLWRSFRARLSADELIDGRYVGCILNSFWNDPITLKPRVVIRGAADEGSARVYIPDYCGAEVTFEVALPLVLHGQARECDIDISGKVKLEGYASPSSSTLFEVCGKTAIVCDAVEVAAETMALEGQLWLEAEEISSPGRLDLRLKKDAEVGWAGKVATTYPWSTLPSTFDAPYAVVTDDALTNFVEECWQRLPDGGVLTLNSDFTIPEDRRMRWAERLFPSVFPKVMALMTERGLASAETMPASGTKKVRMHFDVTWTELRKAIKEPTAAPETLRTFIDSARGAIG